MASTIKQGFKFVDGKIVRDPKHRNVSKQMRAIKGKRKRVVSRKKVQAMIKGFR